LDKRRLRKGLRNRDCERIFALVVRQGVGRHAVPQVLSQKLRWIQWHEIFLSADTKLSHNGRSKTKLGIMRGVMPDPCPAASRLDSWRLLFVAIAPLPLKSQDGIAEALGDVMSINLKAVVKPIFGFQGTLQGAGTLSQAGIDGFLPLSIGDNLERQQMASEALRHNMNLRGMHQGVN
jgi:hypothetical protein